MSSLSDFNSAARLREIIRTVAAEVVEEMYPAPRSGTVTAVDASLRIATVQYPDTSSVTIPYGSVMPQVGAVVRVAGATGAKYIEDITVNNDPVPATGSLRMRLSATDAANLTSSLHAFQIGLTTAPNLIMDSGEIIARNNGAAAVLNLNVATGGNVAVGGDITLATNKRIRSTGAWLGDRILWYNDISGSGGYTTGIDGSTLYHNVPASSSHKFRVNGTQKGIVDTSGIYADALNGSGFVRIGIVGGGAWNGVDSNGGYLLLSQGGQGQVYLRSRGAHNVNIGATESNTLVVGNGSVIVNGIFSSTGNASFANSTASSHNSTYQVRGSAANHGASYDTAQGFFGASGNEGTVSIWANNAASQFRQGSGTQTVYCRNYNDSAYTTLNGIFTNFSSGNFKQDIASWPQLIVPAGAAVNDLERSPLSKSALETAMELRPVSYRWKPEVKLPKTPPPSRMAALRRLNGMRGKKGQRRWEEENPDEFFHDCERDPDDCYRDADGNCITMRDWNEGQVGFIAQEVAEVIPQAAVLDHKSGEYEGLDAVALTAVAIGAIQEQQKIIEALIQRVTELESMIAAP